MTDNRERTGSELLSPYGSVAAVLGTAAVRAVNVLADVPVWRGEVERIWLPSDHLAFLETIRFAHEVREAQTTLSVPREAGDSRDNMPLGWHLDNFHHALPMHEGERHWLTWLFYYTEGGGPQEDATDMVMEHSKPEYLEGYFDAGRWHPLDGSGLLDRWWAWRRAALEYEKNSTIDMACKALCAVADITVPSFPLTHTASRIADASYAELKQLRQVQRSQTSETFN